MYYSQRLSNYNIPITNLFFPLFLWPTNKLYFLIRLFILLIQQNLKILDKFVTQFNFYNYIFLYCQMNRIISSRQLYFPQLINQQSINDNRQSLYDKSKWMKAFKQNQIEIQCQKIKNLAQKKKISIESQRINKEKLYSNLDNYMTKLNQNEQIDLQKSIEIMYELRILKHLKSIEYLESKTPKQISPTLKKQLKFVYRLWEILNVEYVTPRYLKIILKSFINQNQIFQTLSNLLNIKKQNSLDQLIKSWYDLKQVLTYPNHERCQSKQHIIQSVHTPQINENSRLLSEKSLKKFLIENNLGSNNYTLEQILNKKKQISQLKLKQAKQQIQNREIQVCTFKPSIKKQKVQLNQKQLIDRLYNVNSLKQRQRLKQIKQQEKNKQELQRCTFRPNLIKTHRENKQNQINCVKEIKGFFKTVDRLRQATQKQKQIKQMKQHIPKGQNYEKLKTKGINPPKFLNRKKNTPAETLFYIEFDLGKRNIRVNIKQNQTPQKIGKQLSKIYCLNQEMQNQIIQIIKQEIAKFKSKLPKS